MAKRPNVIPRAAASRILLNVGAKRVSADAAEAMAEVLQQKGEQIAARALQLAKHTGRKTIHEEDIKMALK